jgi:hypothetical protein
MPRRGSPGTRAREHPARSRLRDELKPRATRLTFGAFLPASISSMTESAQQPLEQQLEEIGAQLAWVRDYL